MKRLIAAAVLAVFIAAIYFTGNYYTKKVVDKSNEIIKMCTIDYENQSDVTAQAQKLKKYCSENEGFLSIFAYHGHIDEIEQAINTMVIYAKTKNSELFYEYSDTVKTLLHQLYEDNSFSMHSIL